MGGKDVIKPAKAPFKALREAKTMRGAQSPRCTEHLFRLSNWFNGNGRPIICQVETW